MLDGRRPNEEQGDAADDVEGSVEALEDDCDVKRPVERSIVSPHLGIVPQQPLARSAQVGFASARSPRISRSSLEKVRTREGPHLIVGFPPALFDPYCDFAGAVILSSPD